MIDLYCPEDWNTISTEDGYVVFSNNKNEVVVEIGDFVGYITVKEKGESDKEFGPFHLSEIEFELEKIFEEFF